MGEYIIIVKIDEKVQGKLILTNSQYRKIAKAEFGENIRLHVDFVKEAVKENGDEK